MRSILVLFHCESNTGYAISTLERVFFRMALKLADGALARIHFGYPSMARGASGVLPVDFSNYLILDTMRAERAEVQRVCAYVRAHAIDTVFGFDQPVSAPLYRSLRLAGVQTFISYWGAPMSSLYGPVIRALKRLEVRIRRYGPDHYIFESQGMADTATLGRGIPKKNVSVVPLGVDTSVYRPGSEDSNFVYEKMGIEPGRRIFIFSGHMEERKGVHVILRAARFLFESSLRRDWHILLFGNQEGDKERLLEELQGSSAIDHVTFGGYSNELPRIHRGCHAGIIASTGWDSLTMSSMEMQASGLPLIVSDLPGLREAISPDKTGFLSPPGDHEALAHLMVNMLDEDVRAPLSRQATERIRTSFTVDIQHQRLVDLVRHITNAKISR